MGELFSAVFSSAISQNFKILATHQKECLVTTPTKNTKSDGRKLRTTHSREKIIAASLKLIRAGDISPSAQDVAKTAKVGLRTVFRRFSEMELLYRELAEEVQKHFTHLPASPLTGLSWKNQVTELLDRKVLVFEELMPYRVAAHFHQHKSAYIKKHMASWNVIEQKLLACLLPSHINKSAYLFDALALSMSFNSWLQLRQEQDLSPQQAHNTMREMVTHLVSEFPD